jgi:hypothetical protein
MLPPRESGTMRHMDLAFLFIGGAHQVLHLAPVAAEISRRRQDLEVSCICSDGATAAALQTVAATMQAPMKVEEMRTSLLSRLIVGITGRQSSGKGPLLAAIRWRARRARAIIAPERTSAALRRMAWRKPLIHFRHGAGDRAPASESRLHAYDLIVVPGEKDVTRAMAQGIARTRLRAAGYVKLDYLGSVSGCTGRLFENSRRTVIYNPHFDTATSSLGLAPQVIEMFRLQDRYNLVFAPHVRAGENLSPREQQALHALAVPDKIIVDLNSPSLFDMRYVQAADMYLGDVSSQLYEFLARPRPVAFINAHRVNWQHDLRYAGWHLGEVTSEVDELLDTVDLAFENHPQKLAAQQRAVVQAFGEDYRGATQRSADILLEFLSSHFSPAPGPRDVIRQESR